MREAGALRVSDDAKATLAEVLEKKALEISDYYLVLMIKSPSIPL